MRQMRIYLAIALLVLASLACQAVTRGQDNGSPSSGGGTQPTEASSDAESSSDSSSDVQSDFPMTSDAFNVTEIGDGSLLFYTRLSAEEALEFYRDEYTSMGYTEREILTQVSDGIFSIVFDGDPSGKSVVIQSVDLGDGSRTISIRLEAVNP